ncbi:MAG TPA: HEAT repeat domain-containing protein [Verrucomicrobiae bacterium]
MNRAKAGAGFFFLRDRSADAVPALIRRLSEQNPETRRFSIQMLCAIGPAIGADAFQRMTNCLSDPHDEVRNTLIWALQFHRSNEYPAEMLIPVYTAGLAETNKVARQNAMIGFGRLGTNASPAQSVIEAALEDPDDGVKSMAKSWLEGRFFPP